MPDGVGINGGNSENKGGQGRTGNLEKNLMCVIDSMEKGDASLQQDSANTSTCVKNASRVDMEKWNAKSMRQCEELGKRPRYLRHNVYRDDDLSSCSCAEWTEIAQPLASILNDEYSNAIANDTISNHPCLFKVGTPVDVDAFEQLLVQHPNPFFVNSVLDGLQNGFWSWADTCIGDYPDTLDKSLGDTKEENELNFICEQ